MSVLSEVAAKVAIQEREQTIAHIQNIRSANNDQDPMQVLLASVTCVLMALTPPR